MDINNDYRNTETVKLKPISANDIWECFKDGKDVHYRHKIYPKGSDVKFKLNELSVNYIWDIIKTNDHLFYEAIMGED